MTSFSSDFLPLILAFSSISHAAQSDANASEGVPSMFDSLEVKVLYQPDGGEG
jgi:hypothetical protein